MFCSIYTIYKTLWWFYSNLTIIYYNYQVGDNRWNQNCFKIKRHLLSNHDLKRYISYHNQYDIMATRDYLHATYLPITSNLKKKKYYK